MRLYKQTGNCRCGGAWEVCELALILQPHGRYGMCLGCECVRGGMFVVRYIAKSGLIPCNPQRPIMADKEA